jgi:glucose-1-phosphate thymidylyltransferase
MPLTNETMCRGIILAGGAGTRLNPCTKAISKQLLPVYDKPMIYYPLSILMLAEIRDILIITTPDDKKLFKRLLGNGSEFGVKLQYATQPKPEGLAQAFLIAEECGFTNGDEPLALVLGDNIFYGAYLSEDLIDAKTFTAMNSSNEYTKATIFGYFVKDPERYGVVEFDEDFQCISIEEKPTNPKSNYAIVGLYFYPADVVEKAKQIKPSERGELEITSLNQLYLNEERLRLSILPRGCAWFDCGTFDSLLEASNYVATIEKRQNLPIANLKEIACNKEWIDDGCDGNTTII